MLSLQNTCKDNIDRTKKHNIWVWPLKQKNFIFEKVALKNSYYILCFASLGTIQSGCKTLKII